MKKMLFLLVDDSKDVDTGLAMAGSSSNAGGDNRGPFGIRAIGDKVGDDKDDDDDDDDTDEDDETTEDAEEDGVDRGKSLNSCQS